jgi:histone acetyltransferase (RNA polymerase elongator complex component)
MKPLIIPIFLPYLGCLHRCLFCNQKVTAKEVPSPFSVQTFIEASLASLPSDEKMKEKQVAFYGGSFTAIPKDEQILYLKAAQAFLASGMIDSIRVSTRPDALNEEILQMLKEHGVKTVELGVQSMIDEVLSLSKRGHSTEDVISAVSRLKRRGFEVGLQLMIGLPGDTFDRFLQTLDRVIDLRPDFVRIHPTLVLKGAPLETLWSSGRYSPLSLDEAIQWLKGGILKLEAASIPVARIGLQPTEELEKDLLAGPYHPALHQLVDSDIFYDMAQQLLQTTLNGSRAIFVCSPREVSNLRGQGNKNILKLKEQFKLDEILIHESKELARGYLAIRSQSGEVLIQRKSFQGEHPFVDRAGKDICKVL